MAKSVAVPFPCVVYSRSRAGAPYVYSHSCSSSVSKAVPSSLRVQDLLAFNPNHNWKSLRGACFLVLVAGDTAQAICVANAGEKTRQSFLYTGSRFARPSEDSKDGPTKRLSSEFQDGHIPLHFYSTLSSFDAKGRWVDTTPVECGIALLPHTLLERDVVNISRWVENNLLKSMHTSVWLSERGHSYNEWTRSLRSVQSVRND
jgi:hypothetical protein